MSTEFVERIFIIECAQIKGDLLQPEVTNSEFGVPIRRGPSETSDVTLAPGTPKPEIQSIPSAASAFG